MLKETYEDYLREIELLKIKYNLSAMQILSLQISASLKFNTMDYDKLKKEFIKEEDLEKRG